MRVAVAFLAAATSAFASDPTSAERPSITLAASSSQVLVTPTFSGSGAQCDGRGNLYFLAGNRRAGYPVLKLARDGSTYTYRLPSQDAEPVEYLAYWANPDGLLWILADNPKANALYVFEFPREGSDAPTRTQLATPSEVTSANVWNFVVLNNGNVLLQGYEAAKKDKTAGRGYLLEFAPSGKLVRKSFQKTSQEVVEYASSRMTETAAAVGADTNVYLLEPNRVDVISQSGRVVRRLRLSPPAPEYRPYQLFASGRRLLVSYFSNAEEGTPIVTRYAVLDASSGEELRLYQPDADLGNSLLCFSEDGLTFYRVEHGHVNLVSAAIE